MKKDNLIVIILTIFFGVQHIAVHADTIRHMQYNLLFYTENATDECTATTNNLDAKDAALKKIVKYVMPDILTVNEIGKEDAYAERILRNVLNTDHVDYYAYLPAHSNPSTTVTTGNRLFYDTRKFSLKSSFYVSTNVAFFNAYRMYYRSTQLAQGDTAFITFIICHLKAGSTESNAANRSSQVQSLMNKLQALGIADNYVISGDFNLYGASEAAYQKLVHSDNSLLCFYDPIAQEGEWHNNYNYRNFHTQSTHTSSDGCASSGGFDDRFDLILVSNYINYGLKKVKCLNETYHALGQDGMRFNGSIISSAHNDIPDEIADALYTMSDHLPVIMDYTVDAAAGLPSYAQTQLPIEVVNPVGTRLAISLNLLQNDLLDFEIYSMDGKMLYCVRQAISAGAQHFEMEFPFPPAIYILRITNQTRQSTAYKIVKY